MSMTKEAQIEQSVWDTIEQRRQEYIGVLQQLVQSAEGGEEALQSHVGTLFAASGCEVESVRYEPNALSIPFESLDRTLIEPGERINMVGKLEGTQDGPSVLFWAHPDSAPVSGIEKWEHPPFAGTIADGRLYGWGASDDLQGVAIMACALNAVIAAGFKPKGTVILGSTPSKQFAQGIIAVMDAGYLADASIYLHPAESGAGLKDIKATTCGSVSFRIHVPGRPPVTSEPGHVVFSHQAINPIDKAIPIYQALQKLNEERNQTVSYPLLEEAIGRSTFLSMNFFQCGEPNRLNHISSECVMAGVLLFPPGETADEVVSQIVATIDGVAQADEWLRDHPPVIEWLRMVHSGTEVREEHPIFQTVEQAISVVTGIPPKNYPLHTGSDIRNPMLYKGIPTLGFGPLSGDSTQNGGHDEWVDVEDYVKAVKVAASIIVNWCGVEA